VGTSSSTLVSLVTLPTAFYDVGDGVLAQPQFAADQPIAAGLTHECEHLGREAVGFRPLAWLAPETLSARLGCGEA
jgi:hypothetical protein